MTTHRKTPKSQKKIQIKKIKNLKKKIARIQPIPQTKNRIVKPPKKIRVIPKRQPILIRQIPLPGGTIQRARMLQTIPVPLIVRIARTPAPIPGIPLPITRTRPHPIPTAIPEPITPLAVATMLAMWEEQILRVQIQSWRLQIQGVI